MVQIPAYLPITAFIVVAFFLSLAFMQGRQYKRMLYKEKAVLAEHRFFANVAVWVTLVAVLLTEWYVHTHPGPRHPLFLFHLFGFAAPYLLLLLIQRFWITGLRFPKAHKPLAYICAVAFAGTFITGLIMMI